MFAKQHDGDPGANDKNADPSLHAHLKTKISREGGMPRWLDVPSGPDARARAITDPTGRAELEIFRKVQRDIQRRHIARYHNGASRLEALAVETEPGILCLAR